MRNFRTLEAAKKASTLQLLFKCARLLDERAIARAAVGQKRGPRLRPAHMTLLPHVTFGGIRSTELAAKLDVTKQAISQLVADMVAMDVVELVDDPTDARAKLVRFTENGAREIARGLTVLGALEAELDRAVGKKKMKALKAALDAILDALEGPLTRTE